jgi:hypothetical protein
MMMMMMMMIVMISAGGAGCGLCDRAGGGHQDHQEQVRYCQ